MKPDPKLEDQEKATQAYAALGMGFVCLIVGLPLWWKTTDVYRVQLPYSDISALADQKMSYTVDIEVISLDKSPSTTFLNQLTKQLKNMSSTGSDSSIESKYRTNVRAAIGDEIKIFSSSPSLQELDHSLAGIFRNDVNHIHIFLLPKTQKIPLKKAYIGSYRNTFHLITENSDVSELAGEVTTAVKEVMVRETTLQRKLDSIQGATNLKPDKESMRAVKTSPGYDITFTLVNPQPDMLDVRWDIKEAIEAYLKPFTAKLEKYIHLNINSQVLFYTGLVRRSQKDKEKNCFYYSAEDLPHMINPLEAKLGSHVSNNPSLEFVVYVPYRDQSPLYIYDDTKSKVTSNSFLSPQWGGIHIYNVPTILPGTDFPAPVDVDMRKVMEVFMSQLRLLLGFQVQTPGLPVELADIGNKGISQWELDSWLRGRCMENLATSTASLTSLAQLLGQISNIVIRDEIGREVQMSVESIKESMKLLSEGELVKAFYLSRQAIISSEKAFFDPSLLELLYFPEDQKFAIYIPLFLPISIPVVMSLLQAAKWYKAWRKAAKDHAKQS